MKNTTVVIFLCKKISPPVQPSRWCWWPRKRHGESQVSPVTWLFPLRYQSLPFLALWPDTTAALSGHTTLGMNNGVSRDRWRAFGTCTWTYLSDSFLHESTTRFFFVFRPSVLWFPRAESSRRSWGCMRDFFPAWKRDWSKETKQNQGTKKKNANWLSLKKRNQREFVVPFAAKCSWLLFFS